MVTPLACAAGTISIHPAEARRRRDVAPREGPRHCRRVRSVTTTDQASRTRRPAFSLTRIEKQREQRKAARALVRRGGLSNLPSSLLLAHPERIERWLVNRRC